MNKIYVIGDLHQSFKPIRDLSNYLNNKEKCTIICLGDFGGNVFFNYRDEKFKEKLGKYNFDYFIIRGNHEERTLNCIKEHKDEWHLEFFWDGKVYVENNYPYIKYAMDEPCTYLIPISEKKSIKTLIIPGAYSVDKHYRLANNLFWFKDEQLTESEMRFGNMLAASEDKWDLILSHTCPLDYEPVDLFLPGIDQSTVDTTMEKWLNQLEHKTKYRLWCWGHYHANRIYPSYNQSDRLMLYNSYVLDLQEFFDNNHPLEECLKCINNSNEYQTLLNMNKNWR